MISKMATPPTAPPIAAANTVELLLCEVVKTEAPVVCEAAVALLALAPPVLVGDEPFETIPVGPDEELVRAVVVVDELVLGDEEEWLEDEEPPGDVAAFGEADGEALVLSTLHVDAISEVRNQYKEGRTCR
jgi:hypothetical protein